MVMNRFEINFMLITHARIIDYNSHFRGVIGRDKRVGAIARYTV